MTVVRPSDEHTHPSEAHKAGCPVCNPDKTVPQLNNAYRAEGARASKESHFKALAKEFIKADEQQNGSLPVNLQIAINQFARWLDERSSHETGVGEIERLRETLQRYVEHHEHCVITAYHGVREKSALSRVFDLTSELRRYFESGTLNEASDLYLLLQEIEAMKAPAQKASERRDPLAATHVLDRKITVCSKCLCACCWHGEFMCDEARAAGTIEKTIRELLVGNPLESIEYWFKSPNNGDIDHEGLFTLQRWLEQRAALSEGASDV